MCQCWKKGKGACALAKNDDEDDHAKLFGSLNIQLRDDGRVKHEHKLGQAISGRRRRNSEALVVADDHDKCQDVANRAQAKDHDTKKNAAWQLTQMKIKSF